MPEVKSKNALPTMGAIYVTISFKVFEIKDKSFVHDGNSQFAYNVRDNRRELLKGAIYNAIKREFPHRTVTAYDVILLDYYYGYQINKYEITRENGKLYEKYYDVETQRNRKFVKDKYTIKKTYVGDFNNNEMKQE